jgi:hypothetical protein
VVGAPVGFLDECGPQLGRSVGVDRVHLVDSIRWQRYPHLSSVTYTALDGMFILLGFEDGPEVAYVEGPEVAQVLEDPDVVAGCVVRFGIIMGKLFRGPPRSIYSGSI